MIAAPVLPAHANQEQSLLAAFLDGHRSPEQIAADHGLSIEDLLDYYDSEPFRRSLERRESVAFSRAQAILVEAYPAALQVLAETSGDPDSPTYARRNASHTITRLVNGHPLRATVRGAAENRACSPRASSGRPPVPATNADPQSPVDDHTDATSASTPPGTRVAAPSSPALRAENNGEGFLPASVPESPAPRQGGAPITELRNHLCASTPPFDPQSPLSSPNPDPCPSVPSVASSLPPPNPSTPPSEPPDPQSLPPSLRRHLDNLTPERAAAILATLNRREAEFAALRASSNRQSEIRNPQSSHTPPPSSAGNPLRLPITSARSPP